MDIWGPMYKVSYHLAYDYRKFIVRSTSIVTSAMEICFVIVLAALSLAATV